MRYLVVYPQVYVDFFSLKLSECFDENCDVPC